MISRLIPAIAAVTAFAASAEAHTGHLSAGGHGHSHWLGYAILIGLGLWGAHAVLRRRALRRAADETRGN